MVLLALTLISFSSALYLSARYLLYRNLDQELSEKAEEIISIINTYANAMGQNHDAFIEASRKVIHFKALGLSSPAETITIEKRLFEIVDRYDLGNDFIHLMDEGGTVIAESQPAGQSLLSLKPLLKKKFTLNPVRPDRHSHVTGATLV